MKLKRLHDDLFMALLFLFSFDFLVVIPPYNTETLRQYDWPSRLRHEFTQGNPNGRDRPTPPAREFFGLCFANVLPPCQALQGDQASKEVEPYCCRSCIAILEMDRRIDPPISDGPQQGTPEFRDREAHQTMNQRRPAPQCTTQ